jgi:N-acetylglucosamine kinase-like BadF-type ATPase
MAGAASSVPAGEFVLGVDGGGASTHAILADAAGRVLGRGLGGVANQHKVGFERACAAIGTAIEGAINQIVGISRSEGRSFARVPIAAACLGLAGVDRVADQERFSAWLRDQGLNASVRVMNDSELILLAGTPEGWGVALISGTGSVCLGRTKDGRTARVGGWGHLLGDEGSGFQIAVDALQRATQAADGRGDAQSLLRAILGHWRLKGPEELPGHVYRAEFTAQEVAEAAVPVLDLAARGDTRAREIVERAARALAVHVETVVAKLKLEKPPLALGGGALRVVLRKALSDQLRVGVGPVAVVSDPATGAVTAARRLLAKAG